MVYRTRVQNSCEAEIFYNKHNMILESNNIINFYRENSLSSIHNSIKSFLKILITKKNQIQLESRRYK